VKEEGKKMKKRMMAALVLAMMIVVLAAGTANAGTRALTTLTNTASADAARVGEPVTFTITETNKESFALGPVQVKDSLPTGVEFVSATPSQGSCSFDPATDNVGCNLGTLPSGATATIDVVVIPTQPGIITNNAFDLINQASASVSVYPSWVPTTVGKTIAIAGGAVATVG
jgi:uncharacterized repeat protein (TIGR01451 family)